MIASEPKLGLRDKITIRYLMNTGTYIHMYITLFRACTFVPSGRSILEIRTILLIHLPFCSFTVSTDSIQKPRKKTVKKKVKKPTKEEDKLSVRFNGKYARGKKKGGGN